MFRNFALRIVIIYIIFGALYITFSDRIILRSISDVDSLTKVQTYKGWGYVAVTGLLLYLLINSQLEKLKKTDSLLRKTEELNERLSKINEELRELDAKRNMFIASMGHELRSPLNSIIGFTDVLLKEYSGKLNDEQRRQLTIIKESSRHLSSLINEVVEVGKIEVTQERLSRDVFDISQSIHNIVETFKISAERKGLLLEVITPGKVEIISDEKKLRQVLINLISNGIKFTDKGKIRIELIDGEDFIWVIVQDTGIGMSKEDMKYLFEPFSIVKFRNRPDVEGTGLGLYITKRIINLLRGEIFVESQLNKGTKFVLKLPRRLEAR